MAALDEVLSGDTEYIAAPAVLETFLERYHASADVPVEVPSARPPVLVVSAPPAPAHLSSVRPAEPRAERAVEVAPARPPSVNLAPPPPQPMPKERASMFERATPIQAPPFVELPPPVAIKTVAEAKPLPVPPQPVRKGPAPVFDLAMPIQAPSFVESPPRVPIKTDIAQDFSSALREARPLPPLQPMRKEVELALPYASDEITPEPEPEAEAEAGSQRRWPRLAAAAVLLVALVGGGVIAARRYATSAPAVAGPGAGTGTLTINTDPFRSAGGRGW